MTGIFSAFKRGNSEQDPMRRSAALTTVYLLEQNRRFEQFMRHKVEELEARVAAQQARLSSRDAAEARQTWDDLDFGEGLGDLTEPEPDGLVLQNEAVNESAEPVVAPAWPEWPAPDEAPSFETATETISKPEPDEGQADIPDYLALMSGTTPASVDDEATAPDAAPDDQSVEIEPDTVDWADQPTAFFLPVSAGAVDPADTVELLGSPPADDEPWADDLPVGQTGDWS